MKENKLLYGSLLCFFIALLMACLTFAAVEADGGGNGSIKEESQAPPPASATITPSSSSSSSDAPVSSSTPSPTPSPAFKATQPTKAERQDKDYQKIAAEERRPLLVPAVVENNSVFELPTTGSHGIALVKLNVYNNKEEDKAGHGEIIAAGTAFTILKDEIESARVLVQFDGGRQGWLDKDYIMINLPDIIPSIIYKDSNAEASLMKNLGMSMEKVTGETLYKAKTYNERLGRNEYIMPVQYRMAVKIMEAQKLAKEQDLSIVLYEGFRPQRTQNAVVNAMKTMVGQNASTRASIQKDGFGISFYISTNTSSHQMGCAVDVSLAKVSKWKDVSINGIKVSIPKLYEEFKYGKIVPDEEDGVDFAGKKYGVKQDSDTTFWMPTPMHELSYLSSTFTKPTKTYIHDDWEKALGNGSIARAKFWTDGAQTLQDIFVQSGMDPLSSEWWHFNDLEAWRTAKEIADGEFEVGTKSFSMKPAEADVLISQR